jgi:drug/metabolite transporter (DMT)-like permease
VLTADRFMKEAGRPVESSPPEHPAQPSPPAPAARHAWPGVLALLVAATLWSLNGPLIKLLGREHVPAVTIACYRSLIGGLVFLPFAWRHTATLRRVSTFWPVAGVLLFTLMTATFVIATAMTAAANAIILQYTAPIWVFLLAPLLLRERPGKIEGLVLLVAMAGVGVIFWGNRTGNVAGLVIALASGLGYGALIVALRGLRPVNPLVVTTLNALGSGLLLLPAAAVWGRLDLSPYAAALMLFMGLVQFTAPYVIFSWGLQRVEAHQGSLIVLIETILNPLWTFLLVGEAVPGPTWRGGPLILVGVAGWLLLSWRCAAKPALAPETAGSSGRHASAAAADQV